MSDADITAAARLQGCMRRGWRLPALACGAVALPLVLTAEPTPSEAKAPGASHCYRSVCHRVRTVEQTRRMIGRTFVVETSYYDLPGVDRFNTGTFTSNGERFDANDPARVASADLPDGTELLLRNPINGRVSHVLVNDFGPFRGNRRLDVTRRVAEDLDFRHKGVVRLDVIVIAAPEVDDLAYRRNRERRATRGHLGVVFEGELPALVSGLVAERQPARNAGAVVASVEGSSGGTAPFESRTGSESLAVAEAERPGQVPFTRIAYSEQTEETAESARSGSNETVVELLSDVLDGGDAQTSANGPEVERPGVPQLSLAEAPKSAVAEIDPLGDAHAVPLVPLVTGGEQIAPATVAAAPGTGLQMAGFVTSAAAASESGGNAPPNSTGRNLLVVLLAGLLSTVLAASAAGHRRSGRTAAARLPETARAPWLAGRIGRSHGVAVQPAAGSIAPASRNGSPREVSLAN